VIWDVRANLYEGKWPTSFNFILVNAVRIVRKDLINRDRHYFIDNLIWML